MAWRIFLQRIGERGCRHNCDTPALAFRALLSQINLTRYSLSELGVTVYFAWTCAATPISSAVTFQYVAGDNLSLTSYVVLLSVLVVGTLYCHS